MATAGTGVSKRCGHCYRPATLIIYVRKQVRDVCVMCALRHYGYRGKGLSL